MNRQIIEVIGVPSLPEIRPGLDLAERIFDTLQQSSITLQNHDIIVIAHTIVSKAEDRMVKGTEVEVSERATELANRHNYDPIQVELALREAKKIIRTERALITETKSGLVCNFSGVDRSNAPEGYYLLLPKNPDYSAAEILRGLESRTGCKLSVIISDTQGRPWRRGSVNLAIGCAGINAFKHNRGRLDLHGRVLQRSTVCQIDELAATAEPIMGQADEGIPVVIIRGYVASEGPEQAKDVQRIEEEDMFR